MLTSLAFTINVGVVILDVAYQARSRVVYGRLISISNRQDFVSQNVSVLKAGIVTQHVTLIDQVCTLLKTKKESKDRDLARQVSLP